MGIDEENAGGYQAPVTRYGDAPRVLDRAPQSVAIADTYACALELGAVWCWGSPDAGYAWWSGSADDSDGEASPAKPRHVASLPALASIHAGANVACGVDGARGLWCWGEELSVESFGAMTGPRQLQTLRPGSEIFADPAGRLLLAQGRVVRELGPDSSWQLEFGQTVTSVRWASEQPGPAFYAIDEAGRVIHASGTSTQTLAMLQDVERLVGSGGDESLVCALTRASRVFCWQGERVPESETPYPAGVSVFEARQYLGWIGFPQPVDTSDWKTDTGPVLVSRARPDANDGSIRVLTMEREEACAVRGDGRAYCWFLGREAAPMLLPSALVDVAVAGRDVCGVTAEGGVLCWNRDDDDFASREPWQPPSLRDAARIAITGAGFCVLHTRGRVTCFHRESGQQDGKSPAVVIARQPDITDAVSLEGVKGGFCAVRRQGGLFCWHRDHGPLTFATPAPVRSVVRDYRDRQDAEKPGTITALAEDGRLWQAALRDQALTPVNEQPQPWQRLVYWDEHHCGLASDGRLLCWGKNEDGQLGRGSVSAEERDPGPVAGIPPLRLFALSSGSGCGSDGTRIWCWGRATSWRLLETTPTRVAIDVAIASFDFDTANGAAVDIEGDVWAWGRADRALGLAYHRATPVRIPVDEPMKQMALGGPLHCGLTRSQRVVCWYAGAGDAAPSPQPVRLPGKVTALAVGETYACAIASQRVFCWGAHGDRKDRDATRIPPVEITRLRHARAVTVTGGLACALSKEGRIACWRMHIPAAEDEQRGQAAPGRPVQPVLQWLDGIDGKDGIDDIEFSERTLHVKRRDQRALVEFEFEDMRPCTGSSCSTAERIVLCNPWSSSPAMPACREVRMAQPQSPTREMSDWLTRPASTHPSAPDGCRRTSEAAFACARDAEVVFPAPIQTVMGRADLSWCAHAADGHLYCLGAARHGQLGSGRGGIRPTPVPVTLP